jgi:hypothetical protein
MQNLPNEIICEISSYLKPKDLANFSLTCKDFKDLLSKEVNEYRRIAEVIKNTYYHIVSIVKKPDVVYDYYIYNIEEAINFLRHKYRNHELLDKYIKTIEPVTVILKPRVYLDKLGEFVETGESKKMTFDSFLYYFNRRFISFYKHMNEACQDQIYDMNKVMKRVHKLLNKYKRCGVSKTIMLMNIYADKLDVGNCIKVHRVINIFN